MLSTTLPLASVYDQNIPANRCLWEVVDRGRDTSLPGAPPHGPGRALISIQFLSRMSNGQAYSLSAHSPTRGARAVPLCVGYVPDRKALSLVGIELRRASCRWRFTVLALFDCETGSHFHHAMFPEAPPIIPDGRFSQPV